MSADLTGDSWPRLLLNSGFTAGEPSAWLAEGLLHYLKPEQVAILLAEISHLCAPGSLLGVDVLSAHALKAPELAEFREVLRSRRTPWEFGTDDPEQYFEQIGWQAHATQPGSVDAHFGRWPATAGYATGPAGLYFVTAQL